MNAYGRIWVITMHVDVLIELVVLVVLQFCGRLTVLSRRLRQYFARCEWSVR